MGYESSTTWHRKTDVKASYVQDMTSNGYTVVASASSRDGYWFVWERDQKRFIEFVKVEKSRDRHFYMKAISEAMGPYYFDCPLRFLDLAPTTGVSGSGFDWREQVRQYHARRRWLGLDA